MRGLFAFAAFSLSLAGCSNADKPASIPTYQPENGANIVISGPIAAAPEHQLKSGDIVLGAGAKVPRHYHHGEEFLYVIGGAITLSRPGLADLTLGPGDAIRIPPGQVHSARAGGGGARAVASWVVPDGKPLRVPVSE